MYKYYVSVSVSNICCCGRSRLFIPHKKLHQARSLLLQTCLPIVFAMSGRFYGIVTLYTLVVYYHQGLLRTCAGTLFISRFYTHSGHESTSCSCASQKRSCYLVCKVVYEVLVVVTICQNMAGMTHTISTTSHVSTAEHKT